MKSAGQNDRGVILMKKISALLLSVVLAFSVCFYANGIEMSVEEEKALSTEINENSGTIDMTVSAEAQIDVKAKAAVLIERSTGKVLYSLNENEKLYPASVTKIMTILLVCESIDSGKIKLTDTVTCSDNASSKGGSQIWLEPGETMTVDELLKATCVYSANDACTLLGEYVAGSESAFNEMMNARAAELGMENTHFDNCTGLDDTTTNHLTTAYDVALMSRELLGHSFIKDYTTIWMDSLRNGETQLVNTNKLVRFYDGVTGLKTGTTEKAGCCVSASAERNGMELIAVVMGSDNSNDRFNSARNMLDWGFANYEIYTPEADAESIFPVKVIHGKEESVNVAVPKLSPVLINKGQSGSIFVKCELRSEAQAPVEENQTLGKIQVYSGDTLLNEYELKAEKKVEKLDFFSAMYKLFTSFSK